GPTMRIFISLASHKLQATSRKRLVLDARVRTTSRALPLAACRLPLPSLDQGQPFAAGRDPAVDQVEIGFLQFLGDRATTADADLAVIHFADRSDFSGSTGEEGLVSNVDLVTGDTLLNHLDTHLLGQAQYRAAGDAVEAGGDLGGVDDAALDDEHVLTGAFGHVAFRVEQQGFVGTGRYGFLQGQHGVHVGTAGLGAGHGDVDRVAGEGTGADADALLQRLVAHVGAPVPGRDGHVHLEVVSPDTHAFRSVEHQRTDVGGFQVVVAYGGAARFVDLFLGERNLHAHDVGGIEQAVSVRLQTKDGSTLVGVVGTDALEHAHAVVQRVGQDMDVGIAPRNHLTIKPDNTITISHRHNSQLHSYISKVQDSASAPARRPSGAILSFSGLAMPAALSNVMSFRHPRRLVAIAARVG